MATYAELEQELQNLAPERVIERLNQEFQRIVQSTLQDNLVVTGGTVTGLTGSAGEIVKQGVQSFIESDVYKAGMKSLLRNINGIADTKVSLYKDAGFEIPVTTVTDAQKLATDRFIDAMNADGLNARFNQVLRTSIYDSIQEGLSQSDLIARMNESLMKGDTPIMSSHVEQIAQAAADSYSKVIDQSVWDKYQDRITHIRVVGSLIETSSPQCRQAVEKYDREIPVGPELDAWIAYAKKHGANEDLSPANLSTLGGHYACRHQWIPIVKV